MRALNTPIRVWHAILAVAVIAAAAVGGPAIAGNSGPAVERTALHADRAAFKASPYHYVGKVINNAAGTQSTIVQACPRGTIPIAGGGGGISEVPGEQALVYSNLADGPDANNKPDSWLVAVDNKSTTDLQASVEAICADK